MRSIHFCVFILLLFASCDPAYRVVVRNRSSADKQVTVLVPDYRSGFPKWNLRLNDSIEFVDNYKRQANRRAVRKIYVVVDSPNATYSFTLPPGRDALLEYGFGPVPPRQYRVIVDERDTFEVWRGAPHIYPAHAVILGGTFVVRID